VRDQRSRSRRPPSRPRERYISNDSTSTGFEGLIGASFSAFRYDFPKLDASVTSQVYPSFSIAGRVRLQNDARVSYELVKDFMLTVTLFDAYDTKPPAEGATKARLRNHARDQLDLLVRPTLGSTRSS
jgi:hypothetical protein